MSAGCSKTQRRDDELDNMSTPKEACELQAPIVRRPRKNGMLDTCSQKDEPEKNAHPVHLVSTENTESFEVGVLQEGEWYQQLFPNSPNNEMLEVCIQKDVSEADNHPVHPTSIETTESVEGQRYVMLDQIGLQRNDISKSISLVEAMFSKRKEKLLANQAKKSMQFREARDRIKKEWEAKLHKEHLHKCALVRKNHLKSEVRIVKLKIVDQEFMRKVEVVNNYLNAEQEKFDSMHKADMAEEEELKYHWLREAQSGRPVDAFAILPQLLNSCFNLSCNGSLAFSQTEQLQMSTTANLPSEPLLLNSSSNDTSVLSHPMQPDLPTPMDSLPELVKSNEAEGDTEELKVRINTDFEKDMMEEIR